MSTNAVTSIRKRRASQPAHDASPSGRPRALNLRRILVPTDFSPCSRKALQYAVALARDYGASITLLHVIGERVAWDEERSKLDAALMQFARRDVRGEVPVNTLVKSGGTLREIENLARTGAVDLLVISTHARAGLPDFCLKSAAEEIVRYAPCPVLVVRDQEHDLFPKRQRVRDLPKGRDQKRARV